MTFLDPTDFRIAEADRLDRNAAGMEEHAKHLCDVAQADRQAARRIRSRVSRERTEELEESRARRGAIKNARFAERYGSSVPRTPRDVKPRPSSRGTMRLPDAGLVYDPELPGPGIPHPSEVVAAAKMDGVRVSRPGERCDRCQKMIPYGGSMHRCIAPDEEAPASGITYTAVACKADPREPGKYPTVLVPWLNDNGTDGVDVFAQAAQSGFEPLDRRNYLHVNVPNLADDVPPRPQPDPTEAEVLEALAYTNRAIQSYEVAEARGNPIGNIPTSLLADRETLRNELNRIRRS